MGRRREEGRKVTNYEGERNGIERGEAPSLDVCREGFLINRFFIGNFDFKISFPSSRDALKQSQLTLSHQKMLRR